MAVALLATCSLAQWALDFSGNLKRIKESIVQAKKQGYDRMEHQSTFYTSNSTLFSTCSPVRVDWSLNWRLEVMWPWTLPSDSNSPPFFGLVSLVT